MPEEVNNEQLEDEFYELLYAVTFNNCTFTNCTFTVKQTGKPEGGDPPPGTGG